MNRLHLKQTLSSIVALLVMALTLFGQRFNTTNFGFQNDLRREIMSIFRSPSTQWMIFICVCIYFVVFMFLLGRIARAKARVPPDESVSWLQEPRASGTMRAGLAIIFNPDFWLCSLLLFAVFAYAFAFTKASVYTEALVFVSGAAIGKGVRLWVSWNHAKREEQNAKLWIILVAFLLLLTVAAAWHPDQSVQFQYRGQERWSGPWANPNTFGLLMGVGVVIAAGIGISGFKSSALQSAVWSRRAWTGFLLICAALFAIGLLKSYSRGAWLGTMGGLVLLGFQLSNGYVLWGEARSDSGGSRISRLIGWLGRNRLPSAILLASVIIISFWQFRQTEWHPVRRAFSVGNKNDFSWRNRLAAWEGASAIMADHPLMGLGWCQAQQEYDDFYRSPKLTGGNALGLNHVFIIGMSLGLPALVCFGMYTGISLTRKRERGDRFEPVGIPPTSALYPPSLLSAARLQTTCRAGAVVLLAGLWFDGGLFDLVTAAPLWVLLELGSEPVLPAFRNENEQPAQWHDQGARKRFSILSGSRFKFVTVPAFFAVLLLTTLCWAKARDPFYRERLSLRTMDGERLSAVAMMPDRGGPFPVVVWCHGPEGGAERNADLLQQFAGLGLAVVGIECNRTNQVRFDAQFIALLPELEKKTWARTNSSAWAGEGLRAQRLLSFLVRHQERQPTAVALWNVDTVEELAGKVDSGNATTLPPSLAIDLPSTAFTRLAGWLAQGITNEIVPALVARQMAETLRAAGAEVQLDVFSGRDLTFEDRPLLARTAVEFCTRKLGETTSVPAKLRPGLWYFWLPAGIFGCVLLARHIRLREAVRDMGKSPRWLQLGAAFALIVATLISAAHFVLPLSRANSTTLALTRRLCVRPELRAHFDWLVHQPEIKDARINDLLEHLTLSTLQSGQFAASFPEDEWRKFVLSPWIVRGNNDVGWRRDLWEWMMPRVRREVDALAAARTVVRELRIHTTIMERDREKKLSTAWSEGMASRNEFESLYVAGLRSIGIGAKLNAQSQCMMFYNGSWRDAPRPMIDVPPKSQNAVGLAQ